jgi:hypothetical protein
MLSQYDQSIYDQGYKYIPQSKYLLNPFQVPAGSENEVPTGIATTYQAQNMGGGGGGGFNPYNTDMSQIRTDFRPDYDFRAYQDFGVTNPDQLTTEQRKEMDQNQEYYYDRPSAMQQKIGGLMNFIPGMGTLKKGAEFIGGLLKDKLPINQRAILENQLRGSGVLTDDIGRIVAAPGQYNTPEGIMAGYNAAQMTDATFDKRTGNIAETLADKYGFTAVDIANLNAGIITPEMEQKAYNPTMRKTSNLLTNYININKAKINFNRKQKKADDIVAFKEKQKAFKDAQNAKDSDNDGVPDYVEKAGGSYDGGYHGAEGGFENTGSSSSSSSGSSGSSGGPYGGGPGGIHSGYMYGGRVPYMMGGLTDLVDIYD